MIDGRTRVFALLGKPVSHSLSPVMHNAAFRALGLNAVYVAIDCIAADVPTLMTALARSGGDGNGGGNLTVPFKRLGAQVVAGQGTRLPACNTFWGEHGNLTGAETDSAGIEHAWRRLGAPAGSWLVLGSGGSALAAGIAAQRVGAPVQVRSRSAARATAFETELRALGVAASSDGGRFGFVVNCTPLGLNAADPPPMAPDDVPRDSVALDLVYARGGTAWVRSLVARDVHAQDGREVLLGQGAAAFEHWFPEARAPIEVMRAALADQLR